MDRAMNRRYFCIVLIVTAVLFLRTDSERSHSVSAVSVISNAQGK
ncbi:small toxic inner membrane protein TimP [Kluyvera genomosp. 3]